MKRLFARFVRDDEGQDLIEYALLAGMITVGVVTAIGLIGGSITGLYETLSETLGGLP